MHYLTHLGNRGVTEQKGVIQIKQIMCSRQILIDGALYVLSLVGHKNNTIKWRFAILGEFVNPILLFLIENGKECIPKM